MNTVHDVEFITINISLCTYNLYNNILVPMYFVRKYTTKMYITLLKQPLYYSISSWYSVEDINKLENVNIIYNVIYRGL